ncbi:MAG: hypothetical protein ACD_55C00169G0004 [uncultured bacterium]|uniref:Uncharacterized protein n=1 Tax=Citrifermentans bemidjiense (strain ATCC BAA-1014 / DSM 16622 / JCM 12645 / Bem) TaxID=404380 RepID=B5E9R8_CITBB|nr:hypothetical protein [Citrifermentans bemidjiense]ACH40242.1 hypothetical protein Gbem_3245 [Citrifermentans bemidjiense Bem]EKD59082.1 MAG: hypothetical protein ACD_55C00169G0004 [uncultured bacterium]
MTNPEIIVNLWYYVDENQQFISALAGRAYIAEGSDEEKTSLLRHLAGTDYPLAVHRPVPDRYVTDFVDRARPGIAQFSELDNPATQLFEEVYQFIELELAQMAEKQNWPVDFKIPENPLYVMTALYRDDFGEVHVLGA